MSNIAISAAHLAKMYRIGQGRKTNYATLRDRLGTLLTSPLQKMSSLTRSSSNGSQREQPKGNVNVDYIWALNDVSFDINHGEIVGIIGRNGAGKSTLLKVLSRITEPTRGRAEIYGRVASLLEVGTGFHPELTGRENVFLNGAILGMRKTEIAGKFDEIVEFAEIEKFIDTPVKFYSSGMYVRLAFAVAAHLEPEILIVDEVLAVGDSRFQKKCLNKMQDVGREGRTVLFVSHSMQAITRMCERTILLDSGNVLDDGPSHRVISSYLGAGQGTTAERVWDDPTTAPSGEVARLRAVRVRSEDGHITEAIDIRKAVHIEMEYEVLKPGSLLLPHYSVRNEEGIKVFMSLDNDPQWRRRPRSPGYYISSVRIPGNFLSEGALFVEATAITMEPVVPQFLEREAVAFQVIDSLDGDTARGDWAGNMDGVVRPIFNWETKFQPRDH